MAELKNKLSAYLQMVRRGEEIIVRDRDLPIARISPCKTETLSEIDRPPYCGWSDEAASHGPVNWKKFWSMPGPNLSEQGARRAILERTGGRAVVKPAFWDSSALVPICLRQKSSAHARQLSEEYDVVAWWATPVEARSAFARELRAGNLSRLGYQHLYHRTVFSKIRQSGGDVWFGFVLALGVARLRLWHSI